MTTSKIHMHIISDTNYVPNHRKKTIFPQILNEYVKIGGEIFILDWRSDFLLCNFDQSDPFKNTPSVLYWRCKLTITMDMDSSQETQSPFRQPKLASHSFPLMALS